MRDQRTGDAAQAAVPKAAVLDGTGGELALPAERGHARHITATATSRKSHMSAAIPAHRRGSLSQPSTGQRGGKASRGSSLLLLRSSTGLFEGTVLPAETSLWAWRSRSIRAAETALAIKEELPPQRGGAEAVLAAVARFLLVAVIVPCREADSTQPIGFLGHEESLVSVQGHKATSYRELFLNQRSKVTKVLSGKQL